MEVPQSDAAQLDKVQGQSIKAVSLCLQNLILPRERAPREEEVFSHMRSYVAIKF